jgi:hypothetical protein
MAHEPTAKDESGFAPVYAVEVLLREPCRIDRARLLASLRAKLGDVEALGGDPAGLHFVMPQSMVEYAGGQRMPAQVLVTEAKVPSPDALAKALEQTWDWEGAAAAVSEAKSALLVTDFLASGLRPRDRLRLVLVAVSAVLEQAPAVALHWKPGARLVDPTSFAERVARDPVSVAVNVRLFRIADRLEGETVMDTLGLAAIGIPDFQLHFVGLDPGRVAGFLYAMARYVHERGPVVEDGHTVPGPNPGEKWRVRMEQALVAPNRIVLDVEPNAPHSARGSSV